MNRPVKISIALAILAIAWIASGSFESDSKQASNDQSTETPANPAFKVRVRDIVAQAMNDSIILQGDVHAAREILIKAETHGAIAKLNRKQGDRVNAGNSILNIAMNDRGARLQQAKAELKVRQTDLEAGLQLKKKNLLSQNQHEQNQANVVAAEAAVKQIQVEITQTKVEAAFSGILDELHVEKGDYVSSGDPIARLVDDSEITIAAQVPQQHIAKVKIGQSVTATLLNGDSVSGEITYIASSANPETRTFLIEAQGANNGQVQRFGQSASVRVNLGEKLAHKLSPSFLDLNKDGELRVKGVDENGSVVAKDVEIIRNERDGVWLDGIPERFRIITVGQGFVSVGDKVDPVFDQNETQGTVL